MSASKTRPSTTTDLALVASFAALIVVAALIPAIAIPGPVPLTLQTLAVLLAGAVLGARRGFLAVALYIALGLIGLPVFAQGASGFGVVLGPSGGYLLGFLPAAAMCGFIVERFLGKRAATNVPLVFAAGLVSSFLFIHTMGITGLMINAGMDFSAAWKVDIAFWPGDVIKNIIMAFVATGVHRAFPNILVERTS